MAPPPKAQQEVTRDMKFTDTLVAISCLQTDSVRIYVYRAHDNYMRKTKTEWIISRWLPQSFLIPEEQILSFLENENYILGE